LCLSHSLIANFKFIANFQIYC